MAYTAISDLIVPAIFSNAVLEQSLTKNALVSSGLVTNDPELSAKLAAGGLIFTSNSIGRVVDQANYAPNVPTDDPSDLATPKKISARSTKVPRLERNDHFIWADLTDTVTNAGIEDKLVAQYSEMVLKWRQLALGAILKGAINETNTPTLVNTSGAAYAAGGLIDTMSAWGDQASPERNVLVMNSAARAALMKAEFGSWTTPASTNIALPTYLGMPVVVDDTIVDAGGVRTMYMFKGGAIRFGSAAHPNPVEVQRESLGGNGGGATDLGFRDIFAFHITGTSFKSASVADSIPTEAELAMAANWELTLPAKAVGVAAYTFTV
jgi:hypothetical protein